MEKEKKTAAQLKEELGRAEKESRQLQEQLEWQTRELLETSTPIMQIWDGLLVAPLIGTLDSDRTERFTETLLQKIVDTNSEMVLVDITGVSTIDTQTAHHLIETVSAVHLMGARVVLTGISPAIAQTLVHLGIDLSDSIHYTRSSLAGGLRLALERLGLKITWEAPAKGGE